MTAITEPLAMDTTAPGIVAVEAYWNARPCNIRHSPKPVGSREYFDEVERRKHFVEPHIPSFSQFERWNGKACARNRLRHRNRRRYFARCGASYTGLELSEASLQLTRQRFDVYGLKGRFIPGNAERPATLIKSIVPKINPSP
jgi:hypothetical protein